MDSSSADEDDLISLAADDDDNDDDSLHHKMDDKFHPPSKDFTVLTEFDIRRRLDDALSDVSSVLSVNKTLSCLLLRRYNWSPIDVYEAWFADEARTRNSVQFTPGKTSILFSEATICGICFDSFSPDMIYSAGCDHPFCQTCWRLYIASAVSDGPGCLGLRCPEPSCRGAAVGLDMIETLASADDRRKYDRYLFRSYVEENRNCKWCPAPGCSNAVEYSCEGDDVDYSVTCNCTYSFCWKCSEESHRPVDCERVGKWAEKNAIESDNTRWILAFTKPCPKCKRPIEKNNGCNRMTCRQPCGYGFCWLCLSEWGVHGYKACNGYKATEESRSIQENAQKHLRKYTHYYERWASNEMSKRKAVSDLQRMRDEHSEDIVASRCGNQVIIGVVVAAWEQIIECRRILKWSYVYGYYLADSEGTKKQLFEYLQGQAESGLERLHHCAERGLKKYLKKGTSRNFAEYRMKLRSLTNTTKTYFENLAKAFENGLSEVDSCAKHSSVKEMRSLKRGRSSI